MKKHIVGLVLLFFVSFGSAFQGCTNSPDCIRSRQIFEGCFEQWTQEFGEKLDGNKTCTKGDASQIFKQCGGGMSCITPKGDTMAYCFNPGTVFKTSQAMLHGVQTYCDPIFSTRQKPYITCLQEANCNSEKITLCRKKLVNSLKEERPLGQFFVIFLIFILSTIVAEGLFVFVGMKVLDRSNPLVTWKKVIGFTLLSAAMSYPLTYLSTLVGPFLSASILFGVLAAVFSSGMLLPGLFTGFHIVWIYIFFSYFVANGYITPPSWLKASETLRVELSQNSLGLTKTIRGIQKDRRAIARAKKLAEERKKIEDLEKAQREKQAKERKEKEEKAKEENKDSKPKSKKRRRRRR